MNREAHIDRLKTGGFDVLVVGGGATGAGIALDAASRGLDVALVERDDFASATSSRSTKLIHGGVRYLEQAVKRLDRKQFNLVRDALKERAVLLQIAPHLTDVVPLVTPLYRWLEVPYMLTGLKLYDWLAGKAGLHASYFVSAREALERFPMLKAEDLRGGVVYYDGQFDDARMNVSLALTAAAQGAAVANHIEVSEFIKEDGLMRGAIVHDCLSGERFSVSAKTVINATGPFVDDLRRLDDPDAAPMLSVSSGVHIVLGARFSPPESGLLIPSTEDGRVLFLLPWQGHTLVGTTDNPARLEPHPKASQEEIDYILQHVRRYFSLPVDRDDILAAWSGLRPLVSDPEASDTAKLSRDHVISISPSGLLTVAGGKWTTYRKMALDAVDQAVTLGGLEPGRASQTETLKLVGARNYVPSGATALQEAFGLESDVAQHLNRAYGDRARCVATLASQGYHERLSASHPYIEAEVVYTAKHESARTTSDVLARRLRLGFLDQQAALAAVPRVVELLGDVLSWDDSRRAAEVVAASDYFDGGWMPAPPAP